MRILKKCMATVVILVNILGMMRVHLPLESKYFSTLYKPVDQYLSFFSLYQDWMMFAYNPSRKEFYLTAQIEFHDKTLVYYDFPQPTDLSHFEKYIFGEKFRKIISDSISSSHFSFLWSDVAKFALRQVAKNHYDKLPTKVQLIKHESFIPDIAHQFKNHFSSKSISKSISFFTYEVSGHEL